MGTDTQRTFGRAGAASIVSNQDISDPVVSDQRMGMLNAVNDCSGGDTHHPVYPSTLTVAGLTRQDIHELVQRLVTERLLEQPHGDRPEVYLTPNAVKLLAASKLG